MTDVAARQDQTREDGNKSGAKPGMRLGVLSAFPPGKNSLNEFGWHIVNKLAEKDEVSELILYADETDDGPQTPVPGVTNEPCWRFNDPKSIIDIIRTVRRTKPDAVIFNLQFATFGDGKVSGGLGLLAPALIKRMGIPTAVILHNLVENVDFEDAGFAGNKWMATLMEKAGQMLTRTILQADYVALTIPRYVELLRATYGAENVILAPHGAFEEIDEPSFDIPEGRRRLMAFGKWGTYKTVDMLVDAYRLLLERGYDDLEVVIAGTDSPNSPGYLAGVEASCADLPNIEFTGYVAEEDVAPLFLSTAVTVFPYTSTTGSSGVLHQAGSYGRAAVLPDLGDFTEVIEEEGFIGEYFDPHDPASLADAMAKLLDDPSKREEMGRQNFAAAVGIPISEVMDWHLIHLDRIIDGHKMGKHMGKTGSRR